MRYTAVPRPLVTIGFVALTLAPLLTACGGAPRSAPSAEESAATATACAPDRPCVADITGFGPTCFRMRDGAVRCAGSNASDLLLRDGPRDVPTPVPWDRAPRVDDLHLGHGFACALLPGGAVECWGSRLYGKLGDGSTDGSRVEAAPVAGLPPVVELAGGFDAICARTEAGAVWCWGGDIEGEQGNGDAGDAATAHRLDLPPVDRLAAGARHYCAVARADRAVWCWGAHHVAPTADPMERPLAVPTRLDALGPLPPDGRLAVQLWGACVIDGEGARCWGRNRDQIGDDGPLTRVPGVRDVVIANDHTCVLTAAGAVRCAGYDGDGRLGAPAGDSDWVTPEMPFAAPVVRLHGQPFSTCAISARGDVACWGANDREQLGVAPDPAEPEAVVVPRPTRPAW